jgi:hypothetical protein
VRGFDLVVDELGADDRFQDDGDGFWNHGGHLLKGQRGAVGNGFVLARGVDLAQVHLGHAIAEVAQNQVGLGHRGIDLSDVREIQAHVNRRCRSVGRGPGPSSISAG